jgi:hypothetical protein
LRGYPESLNPESISGKTLYFLLCPLSHSHKWVINFVVKRSEFVINPFQDHAEFIGKAAKNGIIHPAIKYEVNLLPLEYK